MTVAAAVAIPAMAVAATVVPHALAHPGTPAARTPAPDRAPEPTPPPAASTFDTNAFAAAARRPPATAPLVRLPQVDLAGLSVAGIPRAALAAYVTAARSMQAVRPSCRLRWWLLAGIGYVESGHARSGGSTRPDWNGIAVPAILGPRLDGTHGFAQIRDTDRGALDHDRRWDRAVGPMQFLPSTWFQWGGADRRGRPRDPQDIRAAALAAAGYLCASGSDLSSPQGMATAVYSYNHSFDYVRLVLSVAARYAGVNPAALGVDRLPRDKPAKKRRAASPSAAGGSASPAATSQSSSGPAGSSPSSAPSPAPSTAPSTGPGGGPSLPPVPTPTTSTLFG